MDNLDNLFDVIKGGVTKDFDIGHVSHRKDGDWKKVAQGKWVPVSLKGQMANAREEYKNEQARQMEQKKAQIAAMEKHRDEHPENAKGWQEEIDKVKAEIGEKPAENKSGWEAHNPEHGAEPSYWEKGSMRIDRKRGKDGSAEYKVWNKETGEMEQTFKTFEEATSAAENKPEAANFKLGQWVRIKKEFLNPGEKQTPYTIANINEGTGRAYIQEHESKYLPSQELVGLNMLEPVPENEGAETKPERPGWTKNKDMFGQDRLTMKTRYGGRVHVGKNGSMDRPYRVDTGTHYNDFKTLEEAQKFAEENWGETKPEPKGGGEKANPYKEEQDHFMDLLGKASGNRYDDPSLVTVERDERGRWKTYYDGDYVGTFSSKDLDTESAEELGWFERPRPMFYEGQDDFEEPKAEPKAEGGKRELKHNADGTPIYETPDDVIYDMVENYNELDRGDLQGVIEAAAMSHGWDENEILEEVDRQAAEKYDLNVDAAPRQLTADTKIRLSKIKRETCDARRTYRIGEISETTGLQKTANGWREVKKGGAGSAAPKAGGNDAERNALIKMRDELLAEFGMGKKRQSNAWYQKKKAYEQRLDAYKKDSAPAGGKAK